MDAEEFQSLRKTERLAKTYQTFYYTTQERLNK